MEMQTQLLNQVVCRYDVEPNEGDYQQDGLWYCGKCHTPRQVRVYYPWEKRWHIVCCTCHCENEQMKREKAAFEQEQTFRRVQDLLPQGVPTSLLRDSTFAKADGSNGQSMEALKRYVQKFDRMQQENMGWLLCGAPGTGKTYAAACLAHELLEKHHTVLMLQVPYLVRELTSYKTDLQQYLQQINRYEMLILDDFGAERPTATAMEKLYLVLDARCKAKRPLVLTSNLTPDTMQEAGKEWERLYDRIRAMCLPLCFTGPSKRQDEYIRKLTIARKELLG